jgi:hypothetical protein
MSERTPGPWTTNEVVTDGFTETWVYDGNADRLLARVPDSDNADFIVKACNTHEELVAALHDLLALGDQQFWSPTNKWPAVKKARAVLAKAQS